MLGGVQDAHVTKSHIIKARPKCGRDMHVTFHPVAGLGAYHRLMTTARALHLPVLSPAHNVHQVVVAMSGGIDSSVAAALLVKEVYFFAVALNYSKILSFRDIMFPEFLCVTGTPKATMQSAIGRTTGRPSKVYVSS